MCKDGSEKETGYRVRVFPVIPVIWHANVQTTPIADYRREVNDYNFWQQVVSHEDVVREDEYSCRSEVEVKTDNRLAAFRLEPGWVYVVNSAVICLVSKFWNYPRRNEKDWRSYGWPRNQYSMRMSQEWEICNPSHSRRYVLMEYFSI